MDVVPRSTASRNGPASGLMPIRFRFPDGGGGNSTTIPATAAWRQASRQPPRTASAPRMALSASHGLGVPSKNRTRHAPQRPSPEHSAGGDSPPDSQIRWKRLPRFHRKDVVEAG